MTDPSSGSWPPPVAAWFDAHLRHDAEAELAQMSDDVVVVDDGRTYEGAPAVREWASRATSEYTYTTTLLAAAADGARTALTVRLDGNFPGGTVQLTYRFVTDDRRIRSLRITPSPAS